jgi:hypothetical protein
MKDLKYLILPVFGLLSCAASNDFNEIPIIEFISISKNSMIQSDLNKDSLTLTIGFEDGDGDIGYGPQINGINLVVIDRRTNEVYSNFKVPAIPTEGANNGVKGKIFLKLFTTCCIYPNTPIACEPLDGFPTNTISFDVYMKDRAGHMSNVITTSEVILLCN